jgi:hypothetical protein
MLIGLFYNRKREEIWIRLQKLLFLFYIYIYIYIFFWGGGLNVAQFDFEDSEIIVFLLRHFCTARDNSYFHYGKIPLFSAGVNLCS